MVKKILFVLLVGSLFLSACASPAPEPVEGQMDCSTVYDYDTTAETKQFQAVVDQLPPLTDEDWVRGDPNAPITIFEYADFQCPACVGFAQSMHGFMQEFPKSIKIVFRHLPLPSIHDKAYLSSMAAEAAGLQGKFWEMHDILYQLQGQWTNLPEAEFVDWVAAEGAALGLDVDQLTADMYDEARRADLEKTTNERLDMGMHYTPFVVVNDRIYRDNQPNLFGLLGIYEFGGFEECPPWVIDPEKSYTAVLDTTAGEIEIELFADVAPLAVNSFVFLAQNGWYDEVYFHRVISGFVAQSGDPSGFGIVGPGYTFINETDNNLTYDRAGILGMANAGVDTNGSQFFITLAPAANLNGGYTIFGEVKEASLTVLDNIALRDPQTAIDFEGATMINGIEIIEQ